MERKAIYFTAPRQVELREEPLPALGADEVLVETVCSAVSAGTEMLVYRGHFPHLTDAHDQLSSGLNYPCSYGYACVGHIRDAGRQADKGLLDRLVFGFQPHASHFICHPSSLIFPPASLPAEACAFLPNMETAVNLVQDGAPILGERVLVLGQGVVGLLVASLLREFPLGSLITVDRYELRRRASLKLGADDSLDPELIHSFFKSSQARASSEPGQIDSFAESIRSTSSIESIQPDSPRPSPKRANPQFAYAQSKFDLTFELSGSPSALDDAIASSTFSGRVVVGSWYGEKKASLDLGGDFHRSRIQLISSQVSTIAPALSGRWDKARRFRVAWEALERIQPQKWITHRFPIEDAEEAYQLLDGNPQETIQVLFEYKT